MKFIYAILIFFGLLNANGKTHADNHLSIQQHWQDYTSWLKSNYPEGVKGLNSGASEAQLAKLESQIGHTLPSSYRTWLSIHNGQHHSVAGLMVTGEFFSTDQVLAEWQIMKKLLDDGVFNHPSESDPKGAIKKVWWNKNWIPISGDGAGNLVCLDMSPDKDGKIGQIIDFDHETVERLVLADSFNEYVDDFLDELKSGKYKYSDDYGQIVPLEDL